jgi:hypothetical protein
MIGFVICGWVPLLIICTILCCLKFNIKHFSIFVDMFYFFFQHMPLEKLDKKHFTKGVRASDQNGTEQNNNKKEIALMEVKLRRLCELLKEVEFCSKKVLLSYLTRSFPPFGFLSDQGPVVANIWKFLNYIETACHLAFHCAISRT